MREIVLVTFNQFMGDWQALYVDNCLVFEDVQIEICDFIKHTNLEDGTPFTFKDCVILNPNDFMDDDSPPTLDGVILQDAKEYWEDQNDPWD